MSLETSNQNNLSQEEREGLIQELEVYKARLKEISIELDHGLIEENNEDYIKQNHNKIEESQTLGAKIDSIEKLLK